MSPQGPQAQPSARAQGGWVGLSVPGGPLGGLGQENELALAQACCSWKAPARWRVLPHLHIPRAPRVSAVSICLGTTLIYSTVAWRAF